MFYLKGGAQNCMSKRKTQLYTMIIILVKFKAACQILKNTIVYQDTYFGEIQSFMSKTSSVLKMSIIMPLSEGSYLLRILLYLHFSS